MCQRCAKRFPCLINPPLTEDGDATLFVLWMRKQICGRGVSCPEPHVLQVAKLEFRCRSAIPELSAKPCFTGLIKSSPRGGKFSLQLGGRESAFPSMTCVASGKSLHISMS